MRAGTYDCVSSYARKSFEGNPRRQAEFDTFFEPAAQLALRRGEPALDADDSQRFLRLYEDLITAGDRDAIWHVQPTQLHALAHLHRIQSEDHHKYFTIESPRSIISFKMPATQ